jgi:hypothetical protein
MKRTITLGAAGLICAVLLLNAQEPGPPPPPHGMAGGMPFAPGMHGRKTVTGEPYSADFTNTVDQTLSDGNTIHRVTQGHVARDGQGRTYSQQTFSSGGWAQKGPTTLTFITDPVAGYSYVLDANRKVAIRRPFHQPSGDHLPANHPPKPTDANRVESVLGTQTIGGVEATGKSVTRTIPAGMIGNAQPIVDKTEIWTAPDLQIVVLAKRSDPRMGQSTYALTNIQRGEPDPSLFQVPAGYTVQDAPHFGRGAH